MCATRNVISYFDASNPNIDVHPFTCSEYLIIVFAFHYHYSFKVRAINTIDDDYSLSIHKQTVKNKLMI